MQLRPFLRLVLGLEEVADGAEAIGVALAASATPNDHGGTGTSPGTLPDT
mgnify:CR=1 FL=1